MKQILVLIALLSSLAPQISYSEDAITLKSSQDIQDASAINKAIDLMSENVMECVNKKLAPANKCYCLYPDNIKEFNVKVNSILEKHPEWENKAINWQLNNDPMGYNLFIPGLRKQLQTNCK